MKNQYSFILQNYNWNILLSKLGNLQRVINLLGIKQSNSGIKLTFLVIFLLLVSVFTNAQTATPPSTGDGSVGTPYQIATLDNLYWLSQNSGEWSKNFIQTANIDASTTSSWNGGAGFSPIGNNSVNFTGVYDGDGHTINSLVINRNTDYVGLFGYTDGSSIENIGLINVDISGHSYTGGLAGYITNNSTINNSYSTGTVSCTGSYNGGLVGWNNYTANIINSYSSTNITSSGSYTGGLIGVNRTITNNCYSTGTVSGSSNAGGLSGYNNGTITNSFWDKETSGIITSQGGTGKTTAEMKIYATFANALWDFICETNNGTDDTWGINSVENNGYPFLAWQGMVHQPIIGAGTEADPYQIVTLCDLKWISLNSSEWSKNFIQTADIDASETSTWNSGEGFSPIGNNSTKFTGVYNGDGHTIDGLYINRTNTNYQGLFGYTDGSEIKNLGMTNSDIKGYQYTGGVVGYNYRNNTITNCYNTGNISSNYMYAGGIVGYNNNYSTITDCYNTGSISVSQYDNSGGIAGYNNNNSTITGSNNSGSISARNYSGGVVGNNYTNSEIINCYNTGSISANNDCASGIAGQNQSSSSIISCYNTGDISAQRYYSGGITGHNNSNCTITDSYNTGTISSNNQYAGGIAGRSNYSNINNCYNNGSISALNYNSGGIVGYANNNTITNCHNTGDISVTQYYYSGGIVGDNQSNSSIINCYNTGSISSNNRYAGGIAGRNNYSNINNCYNNGSVYANYYYSGGITGNNYNYSTVTSCYNIGAISANNGNWGGIAGYNDNNTSTVTNSFNNIDICTNNNYSTGLTTAQMKIPTNFINASWDFADETANGNDDIWGINSAENNGYLFLMWQGYSNNPGIDIQKPEFTSVAPSDTTVYPDAGQDYYTLTDYLPSTTATDNVGVISITQSPAAGTHLAIGDNIITITATDGTGNERIQEFFIVIKPADLDGEGTEFDPYQISVLSHLQWLSQSHSIWDKHFIQIADINATETQNWDNNKGFSPIGNRTDEFTGVYNGNNYTIDSLFINRTGTDYVGLFGYTNGSEIKNLGMTNSDIKGYKYTGGIVGYSNSNTITNCYNTGTIIANYGYSGGIVGYNQSSSSITNCYNTGSISANYYNSGGITGYNTINSTITGCNNTGDISVTRYDYSGGITGYNQSSSSIINCYNTGNVSTQRNYSGGITGYIQNSSSIINCYNTGNIYSNNYYSGGIAGRSQSATINNCYNSGNISTAYHYSGGIAGIKYYGTLENCYNIGIISAGSGNWGGIAGYNSSGTLTNSFNNTDICTNDGYGIGLTTSEMQQMCVYADGNWDFMSEVSNGSDDIWGINSTENNGYPFLSWQGYEHTGECCGYTTILQGSGTEADPYQITDLCDFKWLSKNNSVWDKYFIQTADIDASSTSTWNNGEGFSPIGNSTDKFTGSYDGNNHVIDGLYINQTSTNYIAMFGYTDGSEIKNLGMTNSDIKGYQYVGGIVGYNYNNSTITNCYNTGSISANYYYSGGIAGYNQNSSSITNCYNTGDISANNRYSGGIAGRSQSANINNCYNTGNISATYYYSGGITGFKYYGTLENCYNIGTISAGYGNWGGIVGYNYGSVTTSFNNTDICTNNGYGTGLNTSEMQDGCTFHSAGWDFIDNLDNGIDDIWGHNTTDNGEYPFLVWQGFTNTTDCEAPVLGVIAPGLTIDENSAVGTELLTLTATDNYANAVLTFSTTSTDVAVNALTGIVTIADVAYFDFETNVNFSFDVKVSDGKFEDTETINIAINNTNDIAPVLDPIVLTVANVVENCAVGTELIASLSASDGDGALNTLTFLTTSKAVNVDPVTGRVTVGNSAYFNADFSSTTVFDVIVSDGLNQGKETVSIDVDNINEAPVLGVTKFYIDENSPVGTEVGTIYATDDDGDEITITINATNVNVDPTTGKITVSNAAYLDAEVNTYLNFNIHLSDGELETTETVVIEINNLNDNAPVIIAPTPSLNIDENSEAGTELLTLVATDADGDDLTFSTTSTQVAIDETTGVITIIDATAFDAEINTSITFAVKVSDGYFEDTENITIAINEINDAPILSTVSLNVDENSAAGTIIGFLIATDDEDDAITFSSTATNVAVDATGKITIVNAAYFDAETRTSFSFDVKLSDGINDITKPVTIFINNLNDNVPVLSTFNFNVDENSAVGTEIGILLATDADGDAITFSTASDKVAIDNNGAVTIADVTAFDYETNTSFSFDVLVSDGSKLSNTETVTVTINDVNDNAPVLDDATGLTVDENSVRGTIIGTLTATDADGDNIVFSTTSSKLFVNANTGEITVREASYFDAESNTSVSFDVKVSDGVNESSKSVTIAINNINDNTPVLGTSTLSINENSAAGTEIGTITATDADGDALVFSTTESRVAIDATGKVTIVDEEYFDAEINNNLVFDVKVSDGLKENTESFSIEIINVNDNTPVLESIASGISINENSAAGTQILTLAATDDDNDAITFSTTNTTVSVNASTGVVTIQNPTFFDAETNTSISFDVKASDGTFEDTKTVIVAINNLNDNAPVLGSIPTGLSVDENSAAGTQLLMLTATDADGDNPAFYSDDSRVHVNASTGEVTIADIAAFDAEINTSISFVVSASDGTQEDTKTVTISINNVNDAPVISDIATDLNIDENSAVGTELFTIIVIDDDDDALNYSTDNTKVAINATGKVTVADAAYFDAEINSSISFTVKVSDGTFEDSKTVTVAINELNDNAPVLGGIPSDLNINENSAVGTRLLTLTASDSDIGHSTLIFSTTADMVDVNAYTGIVTIADATAFDAETNSSLSFVVKVSDGINEDTKTVNLTINDLNDAPVLGTISTNLSVNENTAAGTKLLTLTATDDEGDDLVFSVTGTKVAVNASTGVVTIADATAFDAEINTSISFTVKVTDSIDVDMETVTIKINNLNDNSPVLGAVAPGLNINENSDAGTELFTLKATDADGDALTFSTGNTKIAVNSSTGVVTIADATAFDAEINTSLSFAVKVSDGTNEDTKTVNVAINNLNDNAPKFEQESYTVRARSDKSGNILTLKATDADVQSSLSYSIADGFTVFVLNNYGELSISNRANIDTSNSEANYILTATVTDGIFSTETTIDVTIDIVTGIVSVSQIMNIEMYPNPTSGKVTINIPEFKGNGMVSVYGINGNLVKQEPITTQKFVLELENVLPGVYLVKINSGDKQTIEQLIIE